MTTSGQDFSLMSRIVLPEVLSVGSSIVLTFVLGRLLLWGLFCPLVSIGVAALELISIGIVCVVDTGADVLYGCGPVKISFSIATICLP